MGALGRKNHRAGIDRDILACVITVVRAQTGRACITRHAISGCWNNSAKKVVRVKTTVQEQWHSDGKRFRGVGSEMEISDQAPHQPQVR